ncbi:GNAT family N-acetyltransferase [Actinomadura sp. 9N407]|uniref:GNAT family N-acetyltransferase n=1 Tax=Actinomadura sp. 9N407 TaxID=3375154 RepID=UPI0037B51752
MTVDLRFHDGRRALEMLEELAGLYERVYAEPPYDSAPKFSRARFLQRTRDQAQAPGFVLVTARREENLLGLAFGFSMAAGSWWAAASPPPRSILGAPKLAVIELIVEGTERGQGLGHALLDALLKDRPESFAILAAVIEADAYGWYLRNGWRKVAEFRVEPPYSDALILDLRQTPG